MLIAPKPPEWALARGLPEPDDDEDLAAYARRLGIDPYPLFADLSPRTVEVAHIRFVHAVADLHPDWWQEHVQEFVKAHARVTVNGHHPPPEWWE